MVFHTQPIHIWASYLLNEPLWLLQQAEHSSVLREATLSKLLILLDGKKK